MNRHSKKAMLVPWLCWFVVACFYLIQYGLMVFPSSISERIIHDLQINNLEMGIFVSAFGVAYVLMQIPAGLMFDRFNAVKVLLFAAGCLSIGCLILIFTNNFWVGIISRLFMGFGGSFTFVGALYLASGWFSKKNYPLVVGLTEAMSGIGTISFGLLFAELSALFGPNIVLWGTVSLLILIGLMIAFSIRDPGHRPKRNTPLREEWQTVKQLFKIPIMWVLALYVGFGFTYFTVMTNMWNVVFIENTYHLTNTQAFEQNALGVLGWVIGGPVFGWLARYIRTLKLMSAGAILQTISIMALTYFTLPVQAELILVFLSGFFAGAIALCFNFAHNHVPENIYGLSTGFLNMFFGGFGIIISPLVGYLYGLTDNVSLAIFPTILFSGLSILCCLILAVLYPKDLEKCAKDNEGQQA